MDQIVQAAVSWAVPAVLAGLLASLVRLYPLVAALQEGVRTSLRSRLVDLHKDYVASGSGCPDWVKREAEQVYHAYHGLGGNGVGTHYYQEIIDAPVGAEGR